jgi:hypothetical protein
MRLTPLLALFNSKFMLLQSHLVVMEFSSRLNCKLCTTRNINVRISIIRTFHSALCVTILFQVIASMTIEYYSMQHHHMVQDHGILNTIITNNNISNNILQPYLLLFPIILFIEAPRFKSRSQFSLHT